MTLPVAVGVPYEWILIISQQTLKAQPVMVTPVAAELLITHVALPVLLLHGSVLPILETSRD